MWRKVVKAELGEGGQRSIFKEWVTLGCLWILTLECGHVAYRRPHYKPRDLHANGAERFRRKAEDALPAPKKINCVQCEREAFERRRGWKQR
jgi:hypothetical protein